MNLHRACLSWRCLPSASRKAQEMIDNPDWGCLGRMFCFVTLILDAPVNNLLEAPGGRGAGWVVLSPTPGNLPRARGHRGRENPATDTGEAQQ